MLDMMKRERYLSKNRHFDDKFYIKVLEKKLFLKEKSLANYVNKFFAQEEQWILINWVVKNINSSCEVNSLTRFVIEEIQKLVGSDFVCVHLFDLSLKKIFKTEILLANPREENIKDFRKKMKKHELYINKVFKTKYDNRLNILRQYFESETTNNFYIIPLMTETLFLGCLYVYKELAPISCFEQNVIDIITDNYQFALENINLCSELKKSNKHKMEFIANVSHELKTPLNAIIGFTELLQSCNSISFKKSKHFLDNIVMNSQHLLKLIEDVLDISKIELNDIDLIYEECSVKDIINNAVYILESMSIAKNISVNVAILDISVKIDKRRYGQVIYNLLNNAIKFTNTNGMINIITYVDENKFYFEISDNGIGISDNAKNKIFEMFSQDADDILKKQSGHGIGLYLCKKIVEAHNGEINFKSTKGKGTKFWFYVPMYPSE